MPRLFTGVELPADVTQDLDLMKGGIAGARWIDRESFHITLRFIGDIDDGLAREIAFALEGVTARPFSLRLSGLGVFGGNKPHTLYAAVEESPELRRLQSIHERICQVLGLAAEGRKFTPHVTIARFPRGMVEAEAAKLGAFLQAWGDWALAPVTVPGFALYRSDLRAEGARYEVLAEYPGPLAGPGWSA